jgi:pyruvate/oxaloacetate carboxyltransferase
MSLSRRPTHRQTVEYDQSQYLHQVPGGMISNMRHQLKIVGMEDKMDAALEEAAHVRGFCYPIMVTPPHNTWHAGRHQRMLGERYKKFRTR